MWFCEKCEQYQCSVCANQKEFNEKHVKQCSSENQDQEQDIQEADAQDGEEAADEDAEMLASLFE
jgi:hypothetical protein